MSKSLSVVTCCSDAISKEFYLKELIESVWDIADEIIVINGDKWDGLIPWKSETDSLITSIKNKHEDFLKLERYHNPWQKRMGCIMPRLQKSIAISHATKDYILLLDADEVIHEKDHEKIKACLELDFFCLCYSYYSFL